MFNNVIVGVDEQPGSRDVIALAKTLVAEDGELTLAHVHQGKTGPVHSSNPGFQAAERERSLTLLKDVRERAGVDAERVCIGSPSVGQGLHELAESQGADLLVMGSCRRGLIGRVFVDNDTQDALNGAPCAVAVAPIGYAKDAVPLGEIGVGYNASPESEHALSVARRFAGQRGARLSAFEAISLSAYFFGVGEVTIDESVLALVGQARDRIAALGGVEPHAAYGAAVEELTVYSASLDLLFVGSRGYGPIGRLMHGSTSLQLARTARCPLIVLTRETSVADDDRIETASVAHA